MCRLRSCTMIKKLLYIQLICYASLGLGESLSMAMPTVPPVYGFVSSGFGYRTSPFTQHPAFHAGLDIVAPLGAPVFAPASGVVKAIGFDSGLGNYIILIHKGGVVTRFGHLTKIRVKKGQKLKRGFKMAKVGMTGRTTGPHLHYEVAVNGKNVDPRKFMLITYKKQEPPRLSFKK